MTKQSTAVSFVRGLLPTSYTVTASPDGRAIRCRSRTGIGQGRDDDDEEHWDYITKALDNHFGAALLEIDHSTNCRHQDFTIYLN